MRIPFAGWVAPFGDPGINDRSHLPRAYRSVPRPSSPLSAKASTRCPYFALERRTQRQGPCPVQPKAAPLNKTGVTAQQAKPDVSPKALELPPRSVLSSIRQTFLTHEDTLSRDPAAPPRPTGPFGHVVRLAAAPATVTHTRFFTMINQQHAPVA